MKKDTLSQLDKLIAEIPDNSPPKAGEFTAADWMEKRNIPSTSAGKRRAQRELDELIQKGRITMRKGAVGNHSSNIYAIANK